LLDLADEQEVREGFKRILERAKKAVPRATLAGVHIQRMITQGQEVIVGAVQDRQFGPLVMFGSGGIEVEGLKDVQFSLAPLTRAEAENMVENTWAGRKLGGYRHLPAADREAVIEALIRLAQLAADFPAIAELEINPLRVLPEGLGVVAVDVRGRVSGQERVNSAWDSGQSPRSQPERAPGPAARDG
jgi:acetyltransferase